MPLLESFASLLTKTIIVDEFKDTDTAFYFDFSAIPALQEDISAKVNTVLSMQYAGYTNEQISQILDIPAPEMESATAPTATESTEPIKAAETSIIIRKGIDQEEARMLFLKMHGVNEKPFRDKLEKWVLSQRNAFQDWYRQITVGMKAGKDQEWLLQQISVYLDETAPRDVFNLETFTAPEFRRINNVSVKRLIEEYRLRFSESQNSLLRVGEHVNRISRIDGTVKDEVLEAVRGAIADWNQSGDDIGRLVDSIMERTNQSYTISKRRAFTIARTETTSLTNDLLNTQYIQNDIEMKRWVSVLDGRTRETAGHNHWIADGEKVKITDYFRKSGSSLMYPGDMNNGSAADVCNCRCSTVPDYDD
jgi:hypothetical protein